jgi:hypothetical protein
MSELWVWDIIVLCGVGRQGGVRGAVLRGGDGRASAAQPDRLQAGHRLAAVGRALPLVSTTLISLLMSLLLGHRLSLWITHKENGP